MSQKTPLKLTEEELNNINAIGNSYKETIISLGELNLERIEITNIYNSLEEKEKTLLQKIEEIKNKEKQAINSILEKYGEGALSLKDGTFIPN